MTERWLAGRSRVRRAWQRRRAISRRSSQDDGLGGQLGWRGHSRHAAPRASMCLSVGLSVCRSGCQVPARAVAGQLERYMSACLAGVCVAERRLMEGCLPACLAAGCLRAHELGDLGLRCLPVCPALGCPRPDAGRLMDGCLPACPGVRCAAAQRGAAVCLSARACRAARPGLATTPACWLSGGERALARALAVKCRCASALPCLSGFSPPRPPHAAPAGARARSGDVVAAVCLSVRRDSARRRRAAGGRLGKASKLSVCPAGRSSAAGRARHTCLSAAGRGNAPRFAACLSVCPAGRGGVVCSLSACPSGRRQG